jgi:hypothetical protein
MIRKLTILLFFFAASWHISLANNQAPSDSTKYLLLDFNLVLQISGAVDSMYNFNFRSAEVEFNYLKYDHPTHPLPYFLHGVSRWWQMMPNLEAETPLGEVFLAYMDSTITMAEVMTDLDEDNIEANFFLAAAYGFKGRYHSENKNWRRAAGAGRLALKYLEKTHGHEDFSPEILFGDALFNYYSIYIRENYPMLRPILMFFPKGVKELGIIQLEEVANNAFYTRVEAQYFLMRIKAYEEKNIPEALRLGEYMFNRYPNNPYFHRFYARMLYLSGQYNKALEESEAILAHIENGKLGYEGVSGRWASFYAGHIVNGRNDKEQAREHFKAVITFSEATGAEASGYYIYSALLMAEYYAENDQGDLAMPLIKKIRENTKRKNPSYKKARALEKQIIRDNRKRN